MKSDTLILGAGPAGLSCAMELSKVGKTSLIIEKNSEVGGLARTFEFKEGDSLFRTDIGPHRFFSKNKYLYSFIKDILGDDWILVKRQTRQLIKGKFYDYPIKAAQAFKNVGLIGAVQIGISYIKSVIVYKIFRKKINNFEDYVVANFGRKLSEFNMINYTEKIWGIPCTQIHPDWAKQRIKGLNLLSAVKNAFLKKKNTDGPKTLVDTFYYPRYGTGTIYNKIAERVIKNGSIIKIGSYPTKISHENNKISEIELDIKGKKHVIKPSKVVSSIPITELIKIMSPKPPVEVIDAVNNLKWRDQVYLFITLNKDLVAKDNWIYFPNTEIPFGRIAEMKNFSSEMCPKDKTSLFVEYFVDEGDKIWNMSKEELSTLTINHLEKLGLCKKEEVRNCYAFKIKNVYPVYDLNYTKNLQIIKEYLAKFSNLYLIGRSGRFQYTNQDHSLEMGIATARSIIENKNYDLDKFGSEDEYFEKGEIIDGVNPAEKNSYNWLVLENRGE